MRWVPLLLVLGGCDRVFGIGDPYQDARGDTVIADVPVDMSGHADAPVDTWSPPNETLLAHFPFDQDLVNQRDMIGATCTGTCSIVAGRVGNALALDGSGCIKFGLSDVVPSFTIAMWTNSNVATTSTLFGRLYAAMSPFQGWQLNADTSAYSFATFNGTSVNQSSTTRGYLVGSWRHIAVTYDGMNKYFYIDGQPGHCVLGDGARGDRRDRIHRVQHLTAVEVLREDRRGVRVRRRAER